MAKRLRHRGKNINWTPEPIRPELLHSFHLPSIGSLAQRSKNLDHEPPSVPFHETIIPSSSLDRNRMPIIRTLPPCLKIKNPSEMVLAYPRTRKLPAFNHADARSPDLSAGVCNNPSSAMAFGKGNNLKTPHGDIDSSGTEIIGSPPPLSLSQKEGNRKQSGIRTLLFSVKIPKLAKRRRVYDARSKQIGWINSGGIIPWAMMAHTSLSKRSVLPQNISLNIKNIPYNNLRRKMRPSEAEPSMAPLDLVMGGEKRKFSVSLLSEEIEEDLMKIRGEIQMPLTKLNKRPNQTPSQLDNLFPGMCFIKPENNLCAEDGKLKGSGHQLQHLWENLSLSPTPSQLRIDMLA